MHGSAMRDRLKLVAYLCPTDNQASTSRERVEAESSKLVTDGFLYE